MSKTGGIGSSQQGRGLGEGVFSKLLYRIAVKNQQATPRIKRKEKKSTAPPSPYTDEQVLTARSLKEFYGKNLDQISLLMGIGPGTIDNWVYYKTRTKLVPNRKQAEQLCKQYL